MFSMFPVNFFDLSLPKYPHLRNSSLRNNYFLDDIFEVSPIKQSYYPSYIIKRNTRENKEESEEEDEEIKYYQHLIDQKKLVLANKKQQEQQQLKLQQEQEKQHQIQQQQKKKESRKLSFDNILDGLFQDEKIKNNSNRNYINQSVNKRSFFDENGNKVVITTTKVNKNGKTDEKTVEQIFDKNDLNKCIKEKETKNIQQIQDETKNVCSDLQKNKEKDHINTSKNDVVIEDEQSGDQIIILENK